MKDFSSLWNSLIDRTYGTVRTSSSECPENTPARVAFRAFSDKNKRAILIAFIGIVGILSGMFICFVKPYDFLFKWKCLFTDGGEIFEMWRKPSVDLYLRVYLWNVTNKQEFMDGIDDKLKVQEVGPYVYKELISHENVTFNDNGTLSAIPNHPLVWVPEMSEGRREDDLLILPNIAVLSIADVVSDKSYFTRLGLNMLIRRTDSQPLVQMTAKEFMFGYKSTLMTLGNSFLSSWIYFDKLGLIDRMYEFSGDYETIYTGEDDINQAGLLDTYSGSTKIPQWDNPCGNIKYASDGTKFPGNIQPEDKLLFFRKSMCRSKYLVKVNETVASGMNAYVYNFAADSDDNGKFNKSNECFCKNKDRCLPPGLLDVRGCYYGFPIALSNPHYLDADPSVLAKIQKGSMKPDPNLHKSFFVIQPKSGLPLELAARFQINMALGNIKSIANCERFDNMVLPLLWAEMRLYELPDSMSMRFKLYINVLPMVETIFKYILLVAGASSLMYSLYKFLVTRSTKNSNVVFHSPWMEDDFVVNIERKLSNYMPAQNKRTSTTKNLIVDSLIIPLNRDVISFQEFAEMKEVDV